MSKLRLPYIVGVQFTLYCHQTRFEPNSVHKDYLWGRYLLICGHAVNSLYSCLLGTLLAGGELSPSDLFILYCFVLLPTTSQGPRRINLCLKVRFWIFIPGLNLLKVSYFRKDLLKFSFEPKNERKISLFLPWRYNTFVGSRRYSFSLKFDLKWAFSDISLFI